MIEAPAAESDRSRLAAAVAAAWPGCAMRAATPLAGDASSRRYVRLHLSHPAPEVAMAMLLPHGEEALVSEELTNQDAFLTELPFLNLHRYLTKLGVPVPVLYSACLAHGVLLLEDLGDVTLAEAAAGAVEARQSDRVLGLFGAAVDTLADLAIGGIRSPDASCQAFRQSYDRALIARELDVVSSHGLAPSDDGPPRVPGSDPEIEAAFAELGRAMDAQPRVLMHRDYHAWNLHLDSSGRIRVIDFQDALIGPLFYDLASLLTDRDTDRFVSPELERRLLPHFATAVKSRGGPDFSEPSALARGYYTAVAYRTLRVIGRFRFLSIEKGKSAYLRFLPRMARQTKRALDALEARQLARLLAARSPLFA
jgi:hypothetical protein